MNKIKSLVLVVIGLLCSMSVSAEDFEVDGIYYKITSSANKKVEVTYRGDKYDSYNNEYSGAVTIPESVTYNGSDFSVTSIGVYAFRECSGLTSVTIPNSVTSIEYAAFQYCSGLTSVTIPNSVTSIESCAFFWCYGLTSVTIGNSVTSIGAQAFDSCSGLTSVTIGNSVESIGYRAFEYCSRLTSVTIPNSVESIGKLAFAYCNNLLDVYCLAEKVPSTNSTAFDGSYPEYATLHVPDASVDSYKATSPWSSFGKIMTLDGNVPSTKTCATPTISYKDGQLICTSETEGATVTTTITSADFTSFSTETIDLTATYNITAIAKKTDYMDSEAATATLCWITGELSNPTGVENIEAHHAVMITYANGVVTVSGVNDGTTVAVYTADGSMAGQATANNNTATITTNIEKGTVAIIKIGDKAIKIVMK